MWCIVAICACKNKVFLEYFFSFIYTIIKIIDKKAWLDGIVSRSTSQKPSVNYVPLIIIDIVPIYICRLKLQPLFY